MNNKFETLQDYIDFYESIPEDKWCVGEFYQGGNRCALGHLMNVDRELNIRDERNKAFSKIHNIVPGSVYEPIAHVNDGWIAKYPQDTPKKRILAYLKDAQEACFKEHALKELETA